MKLGLSIIFTISTLAVLAPMVSPYDPTDYELSARLQTPSSIHFLGTDTNGTDIFTQLLFGARLSLTISFIVIGISVFIGLIFGSLAGYWGGSIDMILMRIIDMMYAFPGFLLALSVIAFLGPSISHLIFALCITGWTSFARIVRSEMMSLKTKEFVSSAKAIGVSDLRIIVTHLWPNLVAPVSVQISFGLAATIMSEAGLSFLGLGVPPNETSWGTLLSMGRRVLINAPHVSIFPGLAIMTLVLGFNLVGDGLRLYFDPKSSS